MRVCRSDRSDPVQSRWTKCPSPSLNLGTRIKGRVRQLGRLPLLQRGGFAFKSRLVHMVEIDSEGIYEISWDGQKTIRLIYATEQDARRANMKMWKEHAEMVKDIF